MQCQSLSIAYPVSRTRSQRVIDPLRSAWRRLLAWWTRQRAHDGALQTLAQLDARTLKDIGMPEEFRAQAGALREARYERLTALLR